MLDLKQFISTSDKVIPYCYKLYDYGNGYQKLVFGRFREKDYEAISNDFVNVNCSEDSINPDEVHRISLSRTKRKIRELSICNNFKYFVTLTLNSNKCDRYSLDECQDLVRSCFKEYQRRCKRFNIDFKYLFITEAHHDGAFHFHGLITDVLQDDIYINNNNFFSSHFFDVRMGYNSFSLINNLNACSFYITKYITKNCVINSHHQIYFCSKGLRRAVVYTLPHDVGDDEKLKDFWNNEISNEFVKCCDFNYNDLDIDIFQWLRYKKDLQQLRLEESIKRKNEILDKIFN